jgi:hypothetical protein
LRFNRNKSPAGRRGNPDGEVDRYGHLFKTGGAATAKACSERRGNDDRALRGNPGNPGSQRIVTA